MASKLTLWNKAGRFITGLVVLCFFLPFFGVSCQGMDIVTVSGADMVYGGKPGGLIADTKDAADDMGAPSSSTSDMDMGPKMDKVKVEPLAIVALACAVIAFGLAWVRSRGALIGTIVVSLAGLGALAGLYVKVKGDMDDLVKAEVDKKKAKSAEDQMGSKIRDEMDLDAGGRMGLWLTGFGLISVAMLAGLAAREKEGLGGVGVRPGAPPGGPPLGPPGGGYPPPGGYPPAG